MKQLKALLILLILCACKEEIPPRPYSEGILNCETAIDTMWHFSSLTNDSVEMYTTKRDCIVGYQLPEFKTSTITGKSISDQNLLGKMSIINFWFDACPPCIAELPGLNKLKEKYGEEEINYVAFGLESKEDMEKFIQKHPFNYDLVYDAEHEYREVFKGKWGYPFTMITNKKNKIIHSFGGGPTDSTAIQVVMDKIEPFIKSELKL